MKLVLRTLLTALLLFSVGTARAAEPCREGGDHHIWISPEFPVAGAPVRILAVSETISAATISAATGRAAQELATVTRGGPPFGFSAEIRSATAGDLRVELKSSKEVLACRRISVATRARASGRPLHAGAWASTRSWNRATENLYSAWIERLFDAPDDVALGFPSLAPALRDPSRNFLWGHLGLREDDPKNRAVPRAEPDCADLPYYLRAYFSWKLGLPFAMRDCNRGTPDHAPTCGPLVHNEEPVDGSDVLSRFRSFLRLLANKVHSGSARTALDDAETDFYPVKLERTALRPGVIYADPYGHVLMVAKWISQSSTTGGRLLAVDGQPDNSVGRKRFWEGTFLFASDVRSAGPGFKAFRPIEKTSSPDGQPSFTALTNETLSKEHRFAPFSMEQAKLSREEFYARMARVINPHGLDAQAAYVETLNALVEQLQTRVGSVDNGEKFMREKSNPVVPMPVGAKIFETVGPWEDYATPSRDMRLLIALDVLARLPAMVRTRPELFVLKGRPAAQVSAELEELHKRSIRERGIEYTRSDGARFHLSVADIYERRAGFEIAYNPNDCVEVRWGAHDDSPDMATCRRRAPADQQAHMQEYRAWFHETRRPPR